MVRKRRSFHTNVTPTPTTGARLTHVRNHRAGARFTPGDHVRWCDEEAIFISEDPRDPTIAIVRLIADRRVTEWPGALAGMRRMQTQNYDTPPSLDPMLPIAGELTNVFQQPIPVEPPALLAVDDDYDDMESNQQQTQRIDRFEDTLADVGDTLANLEHHKKRR